MKKFSCLKFLLIIFVSVLVVGCSENNVNNNDLKEENLAIPLGDTGISIEIPSEQGFEEKTSQISDFYGQGASGEWAITIKHESKEDYTLEEYAEIVAKANDAEAAKIAADGNYYYEHANDEYYFYVAIRQDEENYYLISLYCLKDYKEQYKNEFADWATTIKINQND